MNRLDRAGKLFGPRFIESNVVADKNAALARHRKLGFAIEAPRFEIL